MVPAIETNMAAPYQPEKRINNVNEKNRISRYTMRIIKFRKFILYLATSLPPQLLHSLLIV